MNIDLSFSSSSLLCYQKLVKNEKELWGKCAKKSPWAMRVALPFFMCGDVLLLCATRVSYLAEPVFKGLANLSGALVGIESCSASKGAKQLFCHLPANFFGGVLQCALATLLLLVTTPSMMYDPQKHLPENVEDSAELQILQNLKNKGEYKDLPQSARKKHDELRYEIFRILWL